MPCSFIRITKINKDKYRELTSVYSNDIKFWYKGILPEQFKINDIVHKTYKTLMVLTYKYDWIDDICLLFRPQLKLCSLRQRNVIFNNKSGLFVKFGTLHFLLDQLEYHKDTFHQCGEYYCVWLDDGNIWTWRIYGTSLMNEHIGHIAYFKNLKPRQTWYSLDTGFKLTEYT